MRKDPVKLRIGLLALGGVSLLAGLNAALVALGVWAPVNEPRMADIHGMVMTLGFMGTLISLERAQSLRQNWAYLAPAVIGAGALALVTGRLALGSLLLIQGTALFALVYVALWWRARVPLLVIQVASALMALLAAILWLFFAVNELIPLLASYLVLTIASERAELAALTIKNAPQILAVFTLPLALLPVATLVWPDAIRAFGLTIILLAIWLLRADIVRKMIFTSGLYRFNAAALGMGYIWLIVAGLTWIVNGKVAMGAVYDLTIHATFIGFGISMIMAHAPVIFPAVLSRPLPYHVALWPPLVGLHVGLAIRFAGYLAGSNPVWHAGAIVNVLSILAFVLSAAVLVITAKPTKATPALRG
ncbi:MAG: hypothetical protein Q4E03_03290 [Trueperella sp.]|nr:hypothetical protein [Trueperella sp.]